MKEYERPYSIQDIRQNYPGMAPNLLGDPVHRWRAITGIELIHKEPSLAELQRIWVNWNLMTSEQKRKSDKKSMEFFGMTNEQHYRKLVQEY